MDTSGSMADGGAIAHCNWWELKLVGESFQWVYNTTNDVTQAWCDDKSQPPSRLSTFTPASPNKITAAKTAANSFIDKLQSQDQSALVSFSDTAILVKGLSNDHASTKTAMNALTTTGATNIGDAIEKGVEELNSQRANPKAIKAMILLTDGMANKPNGNGYDENPLDVAYALSKAQTAANLGYKIFTIGLGTDGEIDEAMLQQIAIATAAKYYHASNGSDLGGIYDQIAWEVCQYSSISGCKFQDVGKDNSISGDPKLAGWEIILTNNSTQANLSRLTDPSGCFTFAGLLEGNYSVKEGENASQQPFIATYPANPVYNVTLAKGQNVTDIDFGNYLSICGNKILDAGEACDDGNVLNGDGCSSACQLENPSKQADLAVSKIVDHSNPNEGDQINYTISLLNNGPNEAVSAMVSDLLPPFLTFYSASSSLGSFASSTGIWNVGNLASGASATLQISALVNSGAAGQTIINTATSSSATTDQNLQNNVSSASLVVRTPGQTPSADLSIVKTVDIAFIQSGQPATFTLNVINHGPADASGVTVNDTLPAGLAFISATSTIGSYNSATGIWNIGNLASGASATLVLTANVSGTNGQQILNQVSVTLDPNIDINAENNSASVTITVIVPGNGESGGGGTTPPVVPPANQGPGGGGPLPTSDAYQNWLNQQKSITPQPSSPGEVKGASIVLPATGFSLGEAAMLLGALIVLAGIAFSARRKLFQILAR